ncbi:hypothetical protein PYCCODRAFT_1431820 [Trametes coccinea BRFM310]|uniref:Nucleolar 27S pre-rRNA processing Urb2/Npa2 C-terminal domain-containing protein n=2 Tax=Trametes TaxID=5324 RepID=A0A1Y2IXV5_TRAC3|nr:hypothetical protein PYCCODRAFT_1431820 [Trametes coccinea BRFM310]
MLGPRNAQDFIRALKASSDPPHVGGPLKIDIARDAWQDTQLYVPNKAEAIVEWLLTRLLKDKSKDRAENPICDSRYWNVLYNILVSSGGEKHGDHVRALRAWLVPLLNRVPIAPIILTYLEVASSEGSLDIAQYTLFLGCVSVLWPLAVPKFSPETLLECFGAVVHFLVARGGTEMRDGPLRSPGSSRALSLIVSSYRGILSNAGSKRKQLYTLFLQKYLQSWLQVATRTCEGEVAQPQLSSDIYDAGIETLFGLDLLKPAADQKHDSALADAFERILQVSSEIVLRPLPRLFASYVQTIKRHKGALFGQGSNQASGQVADQLQANAMGFYALCSTLARAGTDDVSWRCRVALLEVVEKENLFNAQDNDAKALLRQDGDVAAEWLSSAWDEQHAPRTGAAVQILTLLTRIDFDLMSPTSSIVLPRTLAVPASVASALQYLDLLLDYDSKTRNLPSSIMHISEAFAVQHLQRIPGGPRSAYEVASSGPLTSLPFLDALSRAIHSFLTPGQVLETVKDVSQAVHEAYERYLEEETKLSADRGEGPRKKRKKQGLVVEDRTEPEYYAVSFALMARTMVAVLRSLPLHTLTDDARVDAEKAVSEVHASVACRALREGLLLLDRRDSWHWQVIILGGLRLHYDLASQPQPQQLRLEQPLLSAMLDCVSEPGVSPELVVEMYRTLLHQCSLGALSPQAVLNNLLAILENRLSADETSWTGKAHVLRSDAEAALALLHILTDRWLPYFNAWATPDQHKRFAGVLTAASLNSPTLQIRSSVTVPAVISRMLHDAQFWELLNIRDAFLVRLVEQTSSLDRHELNRLLSQLASGALHPGSDEILRCVSVYDILLLTPPEYLPRATHVEFLKRGFALDVLVFAGLGEASASTLSPRHLLVIREFLRRTIGYLGSVVNVVAKEFLEYLVGHSSAVGSDAVHAIDGVSSVTMELVDMHQGALVRAAKRGDSSVITELIGRYAELYTADGPANERRPSLLLIDSFVQEGSAADFPDYVLNSIRRMNDHMLAFTMKQLSSSSLDMQEPPVNLDFLDTWSHVQALRRWLKREDGDQLPVIGKPLVRRLLTWTGDKQEVAKLASTVLSILLGEVQAAPTQQGQLEYVVVAYLAFARMCDQQEMKQLESRLSSAFRTLSIEEFSTVLELIFDGLPLGRGLSVEDVVNLVRFAMTSLQHAPEGTSRICQSFTRKCLNLFADDEHFVTNRELRGQVVEFVVRQCGDRPASLRVGDLPSLWSLLRSLLAGSSTHDQSTDIAVYHGVVDILSALVRLRRDLVLNTLPHLGFVLRQLVFCLRSLRPQLGGRQSRMVMDTLPRWIAPSQPLGAQESKALARLLTTLTTKTMIRVHGAAAETQKPESLVRPFSKHAAYVLTAYVEAVNDPLCFVSSGVRRELQPGLFALCDMLGEHNRDAMMVSALDTGGKATMKALWKEYEKQRYVGKG